jgi:hypothetical protein
MHLVLLDGIGPSPKSITQPIKTKRLQRLPQKAYLGYTIRVTFNKLSDQTSRLPDVPKSLKIKEKKNYQYPCSGNMSY